MQTIKPPVLLGRDDWIFWAIITANKIKGLSKSNNEYSITVPRGWCEPIAENCETFLAVSGEIRTFATADCYKNSIYIAIL